MKNILVILFIGKYNYEKRYSLFPFYVKGYYTVKLSDIKFKMVEAFFSAKGDSEGIKESSLSNTVESLSKLISLDTSLLLSSPHSEYTEPLLAYRDLSKGDYCLGYICEDDNILYVVLRKNKYLACINLAAPIKIERYCSFRDVKEVFNEAESLDNITFKTCFI